MTGEDTNLPFYKNLMEGEKALIVKEMLEDGWNLGSIIEKHYIRWGKFEDVEVEAFNKNGIWIKIENVQGNSTDLRKTRKKGGKKNGRKNIQRNM